LQHRVDASNKVAREIQKPSDEKSQNIHSPFLLSICLLPSPFFNLSTLQG
jgi:hypothetical protein